MEAEDKKEERQKTNEKIEKIQHDKIRGRVVIFDPEKSEFAKNLKLNKKGDYIQKSKWK